MRALLLAAGLGTRLRPLTDTVPKCLVNVRGKPLLGHWFDTLFPAGIERILINTHYLPGPVRKYVSESPWRDRIDLVHEDSLLGTGGTVLQNQRWLGEAPFLLAHADNLTRFNVKSFIDKHLNRPPNVAITMMTFTTDCPEACGIVEEDNRGVVTAFYEKVENPPGNHANAAVYVIEPEVVEFIGSLKKPFVDLSTEVIPAYLGRIATFHNAGYHRDIGTLASLEKAEREF